MEGEWNFWAQCVVGLTNSEFVKTVKGMAGKWVLKGGILVGGLVVWGWGQTPPVLTESGLAEAGRSRQYWVDTVKRPLFFSAGGANITWDLQGRVSIGDTAWIRYYFPGQTPYAGMDPCVDTSDYAERADSVRQVYVFLKNIAGSQQTITVVTCIGFWNFTQYVILKPLDVDTVGYVPATYGDGWREDGLYWGWLPNGSDTLDIYVHTRHEDSIVAWGTLVMPDGTSLTVLGVESKRVLRVRAVSRLIGNTLYDRSDSLLRLDLERDTASRAPYAVFYLNFARDTVLLTLWSSDFMPAGTTGLSTSSGGEQGGSGPVVLWYCRLEGCGLLVRGLPAEREGLLTVSTVDGRVVWRRGLSSLQEDVFYRVEGIGSSSVAPHVITIWIWDEGGEGKVYRYLVGR